MANPTSNLAIVPVPPLPRAADDGARIERALERSLQASTSAAAPSLARGFRHAVFPGGARIRPRLVLEVARATGDRHPEVADAAAAAIEMIHCASLVHDDLPCFDDAETRRGRPSVHRAFGEPIAVLVGDGLIVLAFEALARAAAQADGADARAAAIAMTAIARGAGAPFGIVAGQAWEGEPGVPIDKYHRLKTAALFEAAVVAGAVAGGGQPEAWRRFGAALGAAYQMSDDLHDVSGDAASAGKPVGRDEALGRPNVARALGIAEAVRHFDEAVAEAISLIPPCPRRAELVLWAQAVANRLVPAGARGARAQGPDPRHDTEQL